MRVRIRRAGMIRGECKTTFFYLENEQRSLQEIRIRRIGKWVRISTAKKRLDRGPETTRTVRTRIDDIGEVSFLVEAISL